MNLYQNEVVKYGKILASRNSYGYTIQLVDYKGKFYEKYMFVESNSLEKILTCTDANLNLYILNESKNVSNKITIPYNNEPSYFKQYFLNYIYENQPQLIYEIGENALLERAVKAAERAKLIWDDLIYRGYNHVSALEVIHDNLKDGYKFSFYNFVETIIANEFETLYQTITNNGSKKRIIVDFLLLQPSYYITDSFEPDINFEQHIKDELDKFFKNINISK